MDRLEGKVYVISVEVRTEIPFAFAQDDIPFGVPLAAAINERGGIPHIYELRVRKTPVEAIEAARPYLITALNQLRRQQILLIETGMSNSQRLGIPLAGNSESDLGDFPSAARMAGERQPPHFLRKLAERMRNRLIVWRYN